MRVPAPGEGERARHGLGEPADHGVVLAGDDEPAGRGGAQDRVAVQRLDRRDVQHADVDVVGFQARRGLQRAHGHQPGGDDHDIAAAAEFGGLAELEPVVVLVEHRGHVAAEQPQVGRAVVRGELRHGLLDVDGVARVDDGEAGAGAQDREVLRGLVAGPVAGGQAGQRADDVDVQAGLGDVQAQEVVGAAGGEHRVGRGERHQAHLGHARSGAEHGLLGHAHLEEPVRVRVAEDVHVGVLGQVGGQPDDLRPLLGEPRERVAERGAGGALAGVGEGGDHGGGLEACGGRCVVIGIPPAGCGRSPTRPRPRA